MKKLMLLAAIALAGTLSAQESEDNTFGGWFFTEINHTFSNGMYVTEYIEHDNYQYSRLECVYSRTTIGTKVLPWLKVGVSYVPVLNPGNEWKHYMETDVIGTLKSGDFKVSIRERYRHGFTGKATDELRSRLKVAYSIPDTKFGIYLAPEVFTWKDEWKKTRHYVACTYDVTEHIQVEGYYLYYAFRTEDAEHVIGLGLNIDL
ncbi:MAG: DUF2490 domain-containing protein [Bacteroidaceae bacterium]|nr:DUF2490 domain-containing protein [Bacteroidaceae bacterium]